MNIIRAFHPDRDRYHYDFGECTEANGWRQYDTHQDASYFGVWIQPERWQVLTFAEGDESLVTCDSGEEFRAELDRLAAFYGDPPPAFTAIGWDGTVTRYYQERP